MKRVLTAVILIPLLLAVIKLAPPWAFYLVGLCFALPATLELCRLICQRGRSCVPWLSVLGTAAIASSFLWKSPEPALPLAVLALLGPAVAMFREKNPGRAADAAMTTLFPAAAVGLSFGFLVGLRVGGGNDELGQDLLLFSLLVIWCCDTASLYGGLTFGRRPLFPRVSPKKTWEGAAFGVLGGLAAALIARLWFFRSLPLGHAVGLALLLSAAGMLGDLVESTQKRAAEVKDSGGMLPGHGGALDRLDSLLFAAPVAYYYYRLVLVNVL
jgi:phosphatidate cytidylyltransferase